MEGCDRPCDRPGPITRFDMGPSDGAEFQFSEGWRLQGLLLLLGLPPVDLLDPELRGDVNALQKRSQRGKA